MLQQIIPEFQIPKNTPASAKIYRRYRDDKNKECAIIYESTNIWEYKYTTQ